MLYAGSEVLDQFVFTQSDKGLHCALLLSMTTENISVCKEGSVDVWPD